MKKNKFTILTFILFVLFFILFKSQGNISQNKIQKGHKLKNILNSSSTKSKLNKLGNIFLKPKLQKGPLANKRSNKEIVSIYNNYQSKLKLKIKTIFENPSNKKKWTEKKHEIESYFKNIMLDPERLEKSLNGNLTHLKNDLSLNEYQMSKFQIEYDAFYYRAIEKYQICYRGISLEYEKMIFVTNEYYKQEDDLIIKYFGKEKLKQLLSKQLDRRAHFYAMLRFYMQADK